MHEWGFWEWLAYSVLGLTAAAETFVEIVRREERVLGRLPRFLQSPNWAFVSLFLIGLATGVFILREVGWVGPQDSSLIAREAPTPLNAIQISKDTAYPWVAVAMNEVGQKERQNNPRIIQYVGAVRDTKDVRDDRIDWASAFAEWTMAQVGIKGPKNMDAFAWLNWGRPISKPEIGCVVIFEVAPDGYRHVGFVVGQTRTTILVLGGNQDDSVSVKPFEVTDVKGYRLPPIP